MNYVRRSMSLSMAGLTLALGCGGRSDMPSEDSDAMGPFGGSPSATGGSTAKPNVGGAPTSGGGMTNGGWTNGGWWASGGWTVSGGTGAVGVTVYPTTGQSCCTSHSAPSCNVYAVVQCVCSVMPSCCTDSWTPSCVAAVSTRACGVCPVGSGGGTASGGFSGSGGTQPTAGSTARGGTTPGGQGGAASKESCCSVHASTGCNNPTIEQCVCSRDAICCSSGWDSVCVSQLVDFGCGSCGSGGSIGTGGRAGTSGGATTNGGSTFITGGTTAAAGTQARGGAAGSGGTATGGSNISGGVSATGGASSTGGARATGGNPGLALSMIDDMEDGNGDIIVAEGRQGYWYSFNDGTLTGVQLPTWGGRIFNALPLGERVGTKFVIYTQGGGFTLWGAGVGLYLKGSTSFYNANKYRGLTFWAKLGPNRANVVRMNLSDDQSLPDGNFCSTSLNGCWDHFGKTILITTSWQRYSYLWNDLTQRGWALPRAIGINPAKLRSIEFSTDPGVDFEIYIDDIAFVP